MKYLLAIAIVLAAGLARGAVNVGDKPTLQATTVSGQAISLGQFSGKIVVVDFWATWCGPCMHEAPHMVQINQQYAGKGLQIIGISLDQSGADAAKGASDHQFTWPQICDGGVWDSAFAKQWGVTGIPHTFIIGPDGAVLWQGHPAEIDSQLEQAFKDHPPQLVDPKVLAAANAAIDQADAALDKGDNAAALKAMSAASPDAMADSTFAARVQADQKKLQDAGAAMLADASTAAQNKDYAAAVEKLQEIILAFVGAPTADQARKQLDDLMKDPACRKAIEADRRQKSAASLLADAQALQAKHQDIDAYQKFKQIVKDFADTPSAKAASDAVADYEKDPSFVKAANDAADGAQAKRILSLADSYAQAGRTDLAKAKYQSVIDQFPDTTYAAQAKQKLDALNASSDGQ